MAASCSSTRLRTVKILRKYRLKSLVQIGRQDYELKYAGHWSPIKLDHDILQRHGEIARYTANAKTLYD